MVKQKATRKVHLIFQHYAGIYNALTFILFKNSTKAAFFSANKTLSFNLASITDTGNADCGPFIILWLVFTLDFIYTNLVINLSLLQTHTVSYFLLFS